MPGAPSLPLASSLITTASALGVDYGRRRPLSGGRPLPRVCIGMVLLGPATHTCTHAVVPPHNEHACAQANMCEAPYQSCSTHHCAMLLSSAQMESRTSPASGQVSPSGSACAHHTSHSYKAPYHMHKAPTSQCNTTAGCACVVAQRAARSKHELTFLSSSLRARNVW